MMSHFGMNKNICKYHDIAIGDVLVCVYLNINNQVNIVYLIIESADRRAVHGSNYPLKITNTTA